MDRLLKPDEIALKRHEIIAAVVSATIDEADEARISQLKRDTCLKYGISRRTLGRWLKGHFENGFEGLRPMPRNMRPNAAHVRYAHSLIPEALIDEAVLLRREVPMRSVDQIIEILELEGKAEKGFLRRSTLQSKLQARGVSTAQMKLYHRTGLAARRFVRKDRNELWQSDVKFGPYLKIDGKPKQIYLVCFIDDATRYVVHGEFYDSLDQSIVEDCLRKAVMKEGLPKRLLFDNGKQFRNKWMERACAMLDIKLIFTAPYSPETKGKVERFNRTVDSFLAEARLKNARNLDEFNDLWQVWLQECYHSRQHDGIAGKTPKEAYNNSAATLRFAPSETLAAAFLRHETRKVDKSGCISFRGKKYEVGITYIGRVVDVLYDPLDVSVLTVEDKGFRTSHAVHELVIGEHTGPRPKPPERLTPKKPETSRLLDAKAKVYKKRKLSAKRAISYRDINERSGGADV